MTIKHKIDAFLYAIFPQTKGLSATELERFFVEYYAIPLIPNKTFTGKQFLSWLYVAWALAVPEHLEKMGLKFEKEFEVARSVVS
jgi:hypothetical protein